MKVLVRGADGLVHVRAAIESGRTLCKTRSHGTLPPNEERALGRCQICSELAATVRRS